MSALRWYHVVNGYDGDMWVLADANADSDWVRARGLIELYIHADRWAAYPSCWSVRGSETEPESVRSEAIRILKQQLRALLNRLETEDVVP